MTDPVELSEEHAGGADPEHVTPEDPDAPQAWPAEAGLPADGRDPAGGPGDDG
ncbi:hypothetical protein [Micromonospora humi]|uniref:Uncharacterized protein n=1 Tax=Micromonospora humi TaxID=745366 RepID=A0A1C5IW14_9ACTN|nr:hypothetical protein [Micromonospora humi]SCG62510.1 hypothetical protein GA0070213_107219 [Micromonospora humi]